MGVLWGRRGVLPLAPTVFRFNRSDVHLCEMRRCGNELPVHRTSRMSIEASTAIELYSLRSSLLLPLLSTNLMLNRDKEKKRCELSVSSLYLFIHVHYLLSMRMHLFKSIYAHTHTHAHAAQSNKHDH